MDFDDAKENIQPLAQGRNASILHASLHAESQQELLAQRKVLEKEIHDYSGDDPLSVWYDYIEWIEQSYPSGGKESGLQEVLSKCLAHFESDERYNQDRRMIKLYIKFIESHKDPAECYQQLFNAGIGTMVADFYIAWAYCYDLVGNTRKADEIFLRGIACRAQPLEELQEARQHFGFSVAQRLMYKDDDPIREETNRQLNERRMALTSLRTHRRKHVGSIRTGSAIKNISPGKVKVDLPSTSSHRGNSQLQVFKDENYDPNVVPTSLHETSSSVEAGKSVVRSIIDAARDQENRKEPGPWNKAHNRRKGKLFPSLKSTNELGFEIHEDNLEDAPADLKTPCNPPIPIADHEIKFNKPFIYPDNFRSTSKPIKGWITPVTTEEIPDANTLPEYNKCKLYPRPNMEFQPEELKAYNTLKKLGIQNNFTKERDVYWGCGPQYNIRLYPHFATKSKTQINDAVVDQFYMPEKAPGLQVAFEEIYNKENKIERQFEEILAARFKRSETIIETADMEETMCTTSEKIQRRKSFFPMRKSMAAATFKATTRMSTMPERNENLETPSIIDVAPSTSGTTKNLTVVEEILKEKSEVINRSNNTETAETKTPETLPSTVSISVLENTESQKFLHENASEIDPQPQVSNKNIVSKTVSALPFEIFRDESTVEVKSTKTGQNEDNFQFKTPALPVSNPLLAVPVPKKLPFEIFDDEVLKETPDLGCGTGGFFDAEETCSTQTFNIFLKAQSASTPIAVVKSKPQRQFGNVLKEVTVTEQKEASTDIQHTASAETDSENISPVAQAAAYSPPRERLSTILETSEHGTTQGTHTTGATTKSTISSPEFDIESHVHMTGNVAANQPPTVLETVKELSCETSVDKMMESLKIQNTDNTISKTTSSAKSLETPVALRQQNKFGTDGLEKSTFELFTKKDQKQVGNFSRLEEKEDTAAGLVYKTFPSIRFQDDKTETIPKILITSQQFKIQEEKTETVPKISLEPTIQHSKYQEDKTETFSKILVEPLQPVKFPEDKTETISKLMLAPPALEIFKDTHTDLEHLGKDKNLEKNLPVDDSFDFFGQSPPKTSNQLITKQIVDRGSLSQIRTAAECRTPLMFESKRFCGKETELTKPIALHSDLNNKQTGVKSNMKDSFLSDFLLVDGNQHVLADNKVKSKSKFVFRDSFCPDFSLIEDSQPQTNRNVDTNIHQKLASNDSILPEFSFIKNTQPTSSKTEHSTTRKNDSILPEFSFIKSTQPECSKAEQKKTYANDSTLPLKSSFVKGAHPKSSKIEQNVSVLPEFSFIENTQAKSNKIEQTHKHANVSNSPPELSFLKCTQPKSTKKEQNGATSNVSCLSEFSFIKNTQPKSIETVVTSSRNSQVSDFFRITKNDDNESIVKSTQSANHKQFQQSFASLSLNSKNYSKSELERNKASADLSRNQSSKPSMSTTQETQEGTTLKNILMDSFMRGFNEINDPPSLLKTSKTNSSLKFLDESLKQKSEGVKKSVSKTDIFTGKETKLKFLTPDSSEKKTSNIEKPSTGGAEDKFFELNCETEMFGTNISMIKNSTWLPNHGPSASSNIYQAQQIQEKSLHIKCEDISKNSITTGDASSQNLKDSSSKSKLCIDEKPFYSADLSIELCPSELAAINAKCAPKQTEHTIVIQESLEESAKDNNMSIYYKNTPKTPKAQVHIWDDTDATDSENNYVHAEPDLNHTHQIIENIAIDPHVNPFNVDLINAFLEQHYVISYLESLPTCKLVGCIQRLKQNAKIDINGVSFSVVKLIGEGAYGAVFCGKETKTGTLVAMKQEKPPNYWEYYICLEIQERISCDEMLPAYMSVDYGLIGNNSSILISKFSSYGSLITVCNKIKKHTMKNVDEYVVMLLVSELLEIIDHLHAVNIIHADVKADNFLLMNKLTYPATKRHLQLIDFGVSIDMKLFKEGQTFTFVHNENSFKCPEMREGRPWTYQLDLYGLAGVIHVLLFGKYMDIERKARGFWMHKTHVPRYINKNLWDEIFKTLLNIRDCKSMPNLQDLRALLKKEMVEKEKYVLKMVNEFNRALSM